MNSYPMVSKSLSYEFAVEFVFDPQKINPYISSEAGAELNMLDTEDKMRWALETALKLEDHAATTGEINLARCWWGDLNPCALCGRYGVMQLGGKTALCLEHRTWWQAEVAREKAMRDA